MGGRLDDRLGHHLQRRCHRPAAALELQQVLGHRPAVVDRSDHVRLGYSNGVEEDLVLDLLPGRHHQRPDLDARCAHVDEHEGDSVLLLC
jgi:hypothetical protein